MIYRYATVIDNNDPNRTGKVKVRVYPEMNTLKETELPWASPVYMNPSGFSTGELRYHKVPEIGNMIIVRVSEDWTDFDYTQEVPFNLASYDYDTLVLEVQTATGLSFTYPQPMMEKFDDGTISFRDTSTGAWGILLWNGSYVYVDGNGNVEMKIGDKSDLSIDNTTGDISINDGNLVVKGIVGTS